MVTNIPAESKADTSLSNALTSYQSLSDEDKLKFFNKLNEEIQKQK